MSVTQGYAPDRSPVASAAWTAPTVRRGLLYALGTGLPWPVGVTALALGAGYLLGLLLLLAFSERVSDPLTTIIDRRGLGFPIIIAASFWLTVHIERAIETMLRDIRPVVQRDEAAYAAMAAQILHTSPRTDLIGLVVALLTGPVAWYGSADATPDPLIRVYVLLGITIVATCIMFFFAAVVRGVRAIGKIKCEPLLIDIFDTDDLAPIPRLSLHMSVGGAFIVALMVIFWGVSLAPIAPYLYTFFTLLSGAAFFYPLLGLHDKMAAAKAGELETVQSMVRLAYEELKGATTEQRHTRAETLSYLLAAEARVASATTWPYNLATLGQLAASLFVPLALTVLQIASSRWP